MALPAVAQTEPPPVNYFRSFVSDLPDRPLITVTVTGAVGVACFTIEELLPAATMPEAIGGGGQYLPERQAVRWGPFFSQASVSVSYRLTGAPGTYPVDGGAWVDGAWFFSPPISEVPVFVGGLEPPTPPPVVATPVLSPAGGAVVPTNVTMSCATTGAVIRFTLDGSAPSLDSPAYTGPLALTQAVVVRARAFTNGWLPSPVASASYGPPVVTGAVAVARGIFTNTPHAPVVQLTATPTNGQCFNLEEQLPIGLEVTGVTGGGEWLPDLAVVRWGPFFQTNPVVVGYAVSGPPGSYPVRAAWSVDGVAGGEEAVTNLVIAPPPGSGIPVPPPQVATPVFNPPLSNAVPLAFTLACATPGASIRYTLDGSVPGPASPLYAGPVVVTSNVTTRARAFTNGLLDSPVSVASFGALTNPVDAQVARTVDTATPTNPLVTLTVAAGTNAICTAVTETLPQGLLPADISAGGSFLAGSNVIVWGPFFGPAIPPLTYRASGRPGAYPTAATWSVDGVSAEGATGAVTIEGSAADLPPTPPAQVPAPIITPALSSNLPVVVSLASPDPAAQVHYSVDGSLPTTNHPPYLGPLNVAAPTTLRARAFRAGWLDSPAVSGNYAAPPTTNQVTLVRSVAGNGSLIPTVTLTATPSAGVACYSFEEEIPPGLSPIDFSPDATWDATTRMLRWGPFPDNAPRSRSYGVLAPWSGTFTCAGSGSFDGFPVAASGAQNFTVNLQFTGLPTVQVMKCLTDPQVFEFNFDPDPGRITGIAIQNGSLNWGDGTQTPVTNTPAVLQKVYANPGVYNAVLSWDWTGTLSYWDGAAQVTLPVGGTGLRQTNTYTAVTACQPVILTHPQPTNQIVWAGTNVQISMVATSAFPMAYQWFFNQTNPIVSPGTFDVLALPHARPEASGWYSVVVTNIYGRATSSLARLTVIEPMVSSLAPNPDGTVTLTFSGMPNTTARTWVATNLSPPVAWQAISTNHTGPLGVWQVTDSQATNQPGRYYRYSTP